MNSAHPPLVQKVLECHSDPQKHTTPHQEQFNNVFFRLNYSDLLLIPIYLSNPLSLNSSIKKPTG